MSLKSIKSYSSKQIQTPGSTANIISSDVELIVQNLIEENAILDEEDVNEIVDNKLEDYTTTENLQNDYPTKTLLSNTLDNYASKELLTQSLSKSVIELMLKSW